MFIFFRDLGVRRSVAAARRAAGWFPGKAPWASSIFIHFYTHHTIVEFVVLCGSLCLDTVGLGVTMFVSVVRIVNMYNARLILDDL